MTPEEILQLKAYRLIQIAAKNYTQKIPDAELANYVRGIVDLQSDLSRSKILNDYLAPKDNACSVYLDESKYAE